AAVRMPGEARQVILRNVVSEIVEQQERIELAGCAEAECAAQKDSGAFRRGLGFDQAFYRSDGHTLLSQAAAADEVDGIAAEPVSSLVMLAADAFEAGLSEPGGKSGELLATPVRRRQPGGDALQHPGAAEIESGQVIQLAIGDIADARRLELDRREKGS